MRSGGGGVDGTEGYHRADDFLPAVLDRSPRPLLK